MTDEDTLPLDTHEPSVEPYSPPARAPESQLEWLFNNSFTNHHKRKAALHAGTLWEYARHILLGYALFNSVNKKAVLHPMSFCADYATMKDTLCPHSPRARSVPALIARHAASVTVGVYP